MNIIIDKITESDIPVFKTDLKAAFKKNNEMYSGLSEDGIPEYIIDKALAEDGAVTYKAILDNEIVGGILLIVDKVNEHIRVVFFYVKNGFQNKGIGYEFLEKVEKLYPEIKLWSLYVPWCYRRNLHFYINKCGFSAVRYLNKYSVKEDGTEVVEEDAFNSSFLLEKKLNLRRKI